LLCSIPSSSGLDAAKLPDPEQIELLIKQLVYLKWWRNASARRDRLRLPFGMSGHSKEAEATRKWRWRSLLGW